MIVLDTHVWLWWVAAPDRLSQAAREAIDAEGRVGVATMSCLEVARLVARGRIALDDPVEAWIRRALAHRRLVEIELSSRIAIAAGSLDESRFPGDPADRVIYATARSIGASLLTADRRIRDFDPPRAIW